MNERSIHQRGRARGSEHDAARDRRPTRCVSQSLNAPYARTRATRFIGNNQGASRYTPIKGDYESAAAAYNIANFDPHPDECGGCPQQ